MVSNGRDPIHKRCRFTFFVSLQCRSGKGWEKESDWMKKLRQRAQEAQTDVQTVSTVDKMSNVPFDLEGQQHIPTLNHRRSDIDETSDSDAPMKGGDMMEHAVSAAEEASHTPGISTGNADDELPGKDLPWFNTQVECVCSQNRSRLPSPTDLRFCRQYVYVLSTLAIRSASCLAATFSTLRRSTGGLFNVKNWYVHPFRLPPHTHISRSGFLSARFASWTSPFPTEHPPLPLLLNHCFLSRRLVVELACGSGCQAVYRCRSRSSDEGADMTEMAQLRAQVSLPRQYRNHLRQTSAVLSFPETLPLDRGTATTFFLHSLPSCSITLTPLCVPNDVVYFGSFC